MFPLPVGCFRYVDNSMTNRIAKGFDCTIQFVSFMRKHCKNAWHSLSLFVR